MSPFSCVQVVACLGDGRRRADGDSPRRHDRQLTPPRSGTNHFVLRIATPILALLLLGFAPPRSGPTLTVSEQAFHVDGRPGFLLGVSLFDALGSAPPRDQDLDSLKSWGVNIVRVWAHWHEPIHQADGSLTMEGRSRLLRLTDRLRARQMILELVLLRPGQLPGQPFPAFASEAARLRAVESMTVALRDYGNVLFDLYNEHDHGDGPITHAALRVVRDKVKGLDPERLVTVSSTEYHLIAADGRVGEQEARNLREEVSTDANAVGVDVVAMHFPRTNDWAAATAARVEAIRAALERLDRRLPIYLSEENRASPGTTPAAEAYQRAFLGAQQAGAAGWVFHTAAGFELRQRPFVDALTPVERSGLSRLRVP